jgi:hypothetical protein
MFHDMFVYYHISPDLDGNRGTTKMCPERPSNPFDTFVFIGSQHFNNRRSDLFVCGNRDNGYCRLQRTLSRSGDSSEDQARLA